VLISRAPNRPAQRCAQSSEIINKNTPLQDLERRDEAADLLRRALAIEQCSDKIHLHYGTLLLDQGLIEEAASATERALALNPGNYDAINLMGRIAFERGDLDAALGHYRAALALNPDLADAYNNMGNVLKEQGALDKAQQAFLAALVRDPKMTGVYVNLADSLKFSPGDPHLAAMEALAAQTEGLSRTERMQLDYALGKAYADLRDHRRSFEHLLRGAAGKRVQIAYDEASVLAVFDEIERTFSAELIRAKSGAGDPTRVPIFVLGMPRSGTTLVEQILASHPKVHGAGELKTFNDVVLTVHGPDGNSLPYPGFVPSLDDSSLRAIGARYLALLRALAPQGERVTDKMPSNYYFAGLIHLALPNARIIHTVRDPVDTCISCFSKLFTAEQSHTYDLAELGRYYRRYARLMAHWHKVLPAGRILDVRYEDVVDDLEGQARRIIAHCDLPWDDRCLSFHETDRPVRTASATQVRQPIYRSAVGRWRVYEEFLGPLLAELERRATPNISCLLGTRGHDIVVVLLRFAARLAIDFAGGTDRERERNSFVDPALDQHLGVALRWPKPPASRSPRLPLMPSLLEHRPAGVAEAGLLAPQAGGDGADIGDFAGAKPIHIGRAGLFLFRGGEVGQRGTGGEQGQRQRQMGTACQGPVSLESRLHDSILLKGVLVAPPRRLVMTANCAKYCWPNVIFLTLGPARNRLVLVPRDQDISNQTGWDRRIDTI
jgi:tetratricopeptide (TPR) repeat protein